MNTLSWRTPTTPLPVETDPRKVFRRMFGSGGTPEERMARMREDRSILDSVMEDVGRLQLSIGPADNLRVVEYLDAIRDVERRIQRTEQRNLDAPSHLSMPLGVPDTFEEHIALMFDLQHLAYQADITRVISFLIGRELSNRTYPAIDIYDTHHSVSHHQDKAEKKAKIAKINTYHVQHLAKFLEKLQSTPDGDGSLLDHTMLLYGSGLSDGNRHNHSPLPILLLGGAAGRVQGGRHIQYVPETPMTNLLLTMLDKVGVPTEQLGDSSGRLRIEQSYLTDV
jgi:hypothetical protein